ncbi:allantoinase AllB [Gracilibacillus caseinilyticus]|uniref:allantoinase n=1 Tax=Gracilibacillus caseinilyticus TaxID=2932256 RepID=A0ABY4F3A2_9BACI|nr:allantoinase AllB [Gracilibacillus caseinilyticus]UOQ48926.1 allantoinase AllB [Gracilibacillus caseinilyticus]
MVWDLKIINGTIVNALESYQANIFVKDGKIAAITSEDLPGEAKEVIDAKEKHVLPGLIDTHVHSRDPGPTYKEDFAHSTRAAAAGGITTVFEMPNTTPPVSNAVNFDSQNENLGSKAYVDYGLWGICIGHLNNGDIQDLHQKGVIGFKFFWGYAVHKDTYQLMYNYKPGMEDVIPPFDDGQVYEMMEEVAKTGQLFAVHAESNELIQTLTNRVEESGGRTYEDMIKGRPNVAEALTVSKGIQMAKAAGVRFHVLHVSSEEGLDLVRDAQIKGLPVTVETCPHYLFLSNEDYQDVGPQMKVYPPVKYKKDQDAIWRGIADGTISHVCSDHAPHTEEEKDGDLWSIPAGMCGVESMVPLMLNAVNEKKITLSDMVGLLSEEPAKLFGIYPKKGSLHIGADADITIVDMEKQAVIERDKLHSKSKVTAYDGFQVQGMPVQTIVRGNTIMKDGEIIGEKGHGKLITPAESGGAD